MAQAPKTLADLREESEQTLETKAERRLAYAVYAPGISGGSESSQLSNIYVIGIDPTLGELKCIRSRCVALKKLIATRIDKRCRGPRSRFGQCHDKAIEIRDALAAERDAMLTDENDKAPNPVAANSAMIRRILWLEDNASFCPYPERRR